MTVELINAKQLASILRVGRDFVIERLAHTDHPQHIPNIRIGRKRFVTPEDLNEWLDRQRTGRKPSNG